jgi:murein biosynthesis integral membrane protein MurJ
MPQPYVFGAVIFVSTILIQRNPHPEFIAYQLMKKPIMLVLISGTNLLLGFLSLWYIIVTLGPGPHTDALFASFAVPQVIFAVVSGSLTHVLIPLLVPLKDTERRQTAWGFLLLTGAGFSAMTLLLFITASWWVPVFVPGFDTTTEQLTVKLLRVQIIGLTFTALSAVLVSVYQSYKRFIWPESIMLIVGVIFLGLLILLLPHYGVLAAAWLGVVRAIVMTALLIPVLLPFVTPVWRDKPYRLAWRRFKPLAISSSFFKTGPVVDKYLSSLAGPGSVSLLHFAQQVYDAFGQIIYRAVTLPMTTMLSSHATSESWFLYRRVYRRQMAGVFITTVVICGSMLTFGREIIEMLVGYGKVSAEQVSELWYLLIAFGGYLVGGGVGQILASSFYAKGETHFPARVGVIGFSISIALKVVGMFKFGLVGIAAAASLHQIFNAIVMYATIEARLARRLRATD